MAMLKQLFKNSTDKTQFISLELSTARFRLNPSQSLMLHYEGQNTARNEGGAALVIESIIDGGFVTTVVWCAEAEMFHLDGTPAELDYEF